MRIFCTRKRIWLISIGDPLPTEGGSVRPHRTSLLASHLLARGHEVLWWASTFSHHKKQHQFDRDTFVEVAPRFRLGLLHSVAYRRNVCLARVLNHQVIARKFTRYALAEPAPDLILCSWPTIDLGVAAVRYGQRTGTPVLLDVRDLWPDVFLDETILPRPLHGLGRTAVRPLVRQTRWAMQHADGILSMSDGCLRWGLRYAGRERGGHDAVFPLAYPRPEVAPGQIRAAEAALRRQGVDPTKRICWFLGTFGKLSDLRPVIDAARSLACREIRHVQFVLSGDGEERPRWTHLTHGLDNVLFTGWIDLPQIAAMMRMADVGLVAMNHIPEALPNKLFEYFAAGLPVLSSIPGETAALLERHQCGLTYTAQDSRGFLEALTILINDEETRRTMGANARRLYEADYSADTVYSRMADFLIRAADPRDEDRLLLTTSMASGS